jgi:hypothetical protein
MKMLSEKGFKYHLDSIEHQTRMHMTYKHEVSLKSIEGSKDILSKAFVELENLSIDLGKEMERLRIRNEELLKETEQYEKTLKEQSEKLEQVRDLINDERITKSETVDKISKIINA